MGDENPIYTLGDYSKPSHEGYRNTTELPVGNNIVPLRSDIIQLVQNGCLFHGLRSEDPNQHLKDFLNLVDSLDLDGLPAGSITTWEDLTMRFIAQFFPSGRTAKLCNDILMFQQHHGESLSEAWTRFKDLLQKFPRHGIDLLLQAIALPQDVPSTSVRRLIELENQVQRLMEAYLAPTQPTQVNKVTTSCEICIGPHDTRYCMEDPKHAFVEYASSHTDEAGAISQVERVVLRKKGIKSPSKLFSPKYLSPASIKELNKNSSTPKRVHFVNSIVVLSKDSNTEEEDVSSTNAREHDLKEVKEVFDDKTKEEEDDDTKYYNSPTAVKELVYHEWLLENPQPS
ncbi:MAK10-like protein [Tanacetum coccineum]